MVLHDKAWEDEWRRIASEEVSSDNQPEYLYKLRKRWYAKKKRTKFPWQLALEWAIRLNEYGKRYAKEKKMLKV